MKKEIFTQVHLLNGRPAFTHASMAASLPSWFVLPTFPTIASSSRCVIFRSLPFHIFRNGATALVSTPLYISSSMMSMPRWWFRPRALPFAAAICLESLKFRCQFGRFIHPASTNTVRYLSVANAIDCTTSTMSSSTGSVGVATVTLRVSMSIMA